MKWVREYIVEYITVQKNQQFRIQNLKNWKIYNWITGESYSVLQGI